MSATADPLARVWDALETHGYGPHGTPTNFRSGCPGHDGENPDALHISVGADGRALLWCHAHGCEPGDIIPSIGLQWPDLFPEGHRHARRAKQLAKPRDPADVVLDAVREAGLSYRSTNGGELWVVESCPCCGRDQLWVHEERDEDRPERPGRVRLCCMAGCPQHEVLNALAGVA